MIFAFLVVYDQAHHSTRMGGLERYFCVALWIQQDFQSVVQTWKQCGQLWVPTHLEACVVLCSTKHWTLRDEHWHHTQLKPRNLCCSRTLSIGRIPHMFISIRKISVTLKIVLVLPYLVLLRVYWVAISKYLHSMLTTFLSTPRMQK